MEKIEEFYKEDCLDVMSVIPDNSIDLIVTDPPYLMNYKSNRRVKAEKFDYIKNDKNSENLITQYISECYRVLKNNTAIYCFCSWHNIDIFKQELQKYFKLKNILVWNKNNHGTGDLKGSYAPKHEFILFGHKGRAINKEKRLPDVLNFNKVQSKNLLHPTEKPKDLLETFIKNNSNEGDIVFDGFAGVATTLLAAKELNRNYIGCELDDEYYELGRKRLLNGV